MATDPKTIAAARKTGRDSSDLAQRAPFALEAIADTLEALRIDLVAFLQRPDLIPRNQDRK